MKNKFLVNVYVIKLDKKFDIYIPIDLKVGEIAKLICKATNLLAENQLKNVEKYAIMDNEKGTFYDLNAIVGNTDIKNGKKVIFF